jgi:hypothetical protein
MRRNDSGDECDPGVFVYMYGNITMLVKCSYKKYV